MDFISENFLEVLIVLAAVLIILLVLLTFARNKDFDVEEEVTIPKEPVKNTIKKPEPKKEVKKEPAKKMKDDDYHVSKHNDGSWQVKKVSGTRALKKFKNKEEAVDFANEKAENQGNEVIVD